jgi:hypothetical protein
MAARISKTLTEEWKQKIQASNLITHLGKCAVGEIEMTSQQIKAAEILLKKVMPDLKSVDMAGEINGNLAINTITRRIINERTND